MAVQFPQRVTKFTGDAWVVLQNNLDYLANLFDVFQNKVTQGTSTITNGNTTVVVMFPTPITNPRVTVTPLADPGGRYWISARTSAGFTINQGVAAPVAGVAYDWIAKGA